MPAVVKVYMDGSCTQPLTSLAEQYSAYLGPQIGLDGDSGAIWTGMLYMRNEGDQKALFVRAIVGNDQFHYVSISIDGALFETSNYVELPSGINNDNSLAVGDKFSLYVRLQVPPGTEAAQWNPLIAITYKTLP